MPEQHREFYNQLPFLIAGSVDQDGWPWASVLFGEPGFVSSPNETVLRIGASPATGDALTENRQVGAPIGLLGIELPTRRRNRMNGLIKSTSAASFDVEVVQSYGNCPQYIQSRELNFTRDPSEPFRAEAERFTAFDQSAIALLSSADTFFVASHNDRDDKHTNGGMDVSHRGGKPGFIKVDGNTLTIPDYIGNYAFNTLGNFLVNPKAGLLVVDFESGDLWQFTGTVDLIWDKTEEIRTFRGAERAWRFHLKHGVRLIAAAPMRWQLKEWSPNTQLTGDWQEAERTNAANREKQTWRPFRITKSHDESSDIKSFYLEPTDGAGLSDFLPGQFLTVKIESDQHPALIRTYTISSAPTDQFYRISVKKEPDGVASSHLHTHCKTGDVLQIRSPSGEFWLDTSETRPALLIAGGVGITPMMSMTRQVFNEGLATRQTRPLTIIHAASTTEQRAFADELTQFAKASNDAIRYVSVISAPSAQKQTDVHYDFSGRINQPLLQSVLPLADYDCYLCGPPDFMQSMYDALTALGIRDERIYAESFGPASLQRLPRAGVDSEQDAFESTHEAVVHFFNTQMEQVWTPDEGTLLEFAEAHGLTPNYGCRSGACGSCATSVVSGKTGYRTTPSFKPEDGDVLICCAVPAKSNEPLQLSM